MDQVRHNRPYVTADRTVAIRTDKLGKMYRLGVLADHKYSGYDFLGFDLPMQRLWPILFGQDRDSENEPNAFWALRDFDLEVCRGEVVGIVGQQRRRQEHAPEDPRADHRAYHRLRRDHRAASAACWKSAPAFTPS